MLFKMLKWTDAGNPRVMAPFDRRGDKCLGAILGNIRSSDIERPDEGDCGRMLWQGWWTCPFPKFHINSDEKRLYCVAIQNRECDL